MTPDLLKGFYRIAIFLLAASVALLFFVERDSAEFFVTLMALGIGTILLLLVAAASWYVNR